MEAPLYDTEIKYMHPLNKSGTTFFSLKINYYALPLIHFTKLLASENLQRQILSKSISSTRSLGTMSDCHAISIQDFNHTLNETEIHRKNSPHNCQAFLVPLP